MIKRTSWVNGTKVVTIEISEEEYNAAVAKAVKELARWQPEQLAVEATWDVQAVGKLIGCGFGEDIRAQIYPAIEQLQAENAKLKEAETRTIPWIARVAELEAENAALWKVVEVARRGMNHLPYQTHRALTDALRALDAGEGEDTP
jgi:threonyl-tRNA synthetase